MQQSRRKSAYYKRILKTILVAFLIPAFLATGFLCYFQARQEIRQAYQHQELSQGRLMNVLSGQLFTGVQMAFHCANDSYIVSLSKTPWNVLAFMDLDDKLRSLKATNAYVSDILVWYDHCPMIYSTDGIYPVAPSATSMRFNGGTIEEYMSDSALHFTFQRISIQRAGQIREEICYLYRDQIHPEISVLVALDARMLGFGDAEGMHGESWVALSKNKGERVLSFGLTDEQISGVLARTDIGDAERTVTLDGERFFALMSSEDDYGLRYLTLTPAASTLPSILFSSLAVLGIGLLLVLCGTRVIFYAADRAYEPVEKLYRSVGGQEDVEKDEFHVIDTVLSDLRSTVNDQKQVLESQIPAVKMQLISRLISGQYSSAEDFNYTAETLGIALTHNYYLRRLSRMVKQVCRRMWCSWPSAFPMANSSSLAARCCARVSTSCCFVPPMRMMPSASFPVCTRCFRNVSARR